MPKTAIDIETAKATADGAEEVYQRVYANAIADFAQQYPTLAADELNRLLDKHLQERQYYYKTQHAAFLKEKHPSLSDTEIAAIGEHLFAAKPDPDQDKFSAFLAQEGEKDLYQWGVENNRVDKNKKVQLGTLNFVIEGKTQAIANVTNADNCVSTTTSWSSSIADSDFYGYIAHNIAGYATDVTNTDMSLSMLLSVTPNKIIKPQYDFAFINSNCTALLISGPEPAMSGTPKTIIGFSDCNLESSALRNSGLSITYNNDPAQFGLGGCVINGANLKLVASNPNQTIGTLTIANSNVVAGSSVAGTIQSFTESGNIYNGPGFLTANVTGYYNSEKCYYINNPIAHDNIISNWNLKSFQSFPNLGCPLYNTTVDWLSLENFNGGDLDSLWCAIKAPNCYNQVNNVQPDIVPHSCGNDTPASSSPSTTTIAITAVTTATIVGAACVFGCFAVKKCRDRADAERHGLIDDKANSRNSVRYGQY